MKEVKCPKCGALVFTNHHAKTVYDLVSDPKKLDIASIYETHKCKAKPS